MSTPAEKISDEELANVLFAATVDKACTLAKEAGSFTTEEEFLKANERALACFWPTGCSDGKRCTEFGECVARAQNRATIIARHYAPTVDLFERHTKAVANFLNELYAIMVDPLADGTMEVSEIRAALLAAATRDRELRVAPTAEAQALAERLRPEIAKIIFGTSATRIEEMPSHIVEVMMIPTDKILALLAPHLSSRSGKSVELNKVFEGKMLTEIALALCHDIERWPASEQLTKCSLLAAELREQLGIYEDTRPLTERERKLIDEGWKKLNATPREKEGA